MDLIGKLESILFVASKPLSDKALAKAIGETREAVEEAIGTLQQKYNRADSGIQILSVGEEIQMSTNPENAGAIGAFIKEEATGELTRAQLETLTVVAYRGPVTRPELEQIRGVNCAIILRILLIRGLIEEQEDPVKALSAYQLSFEALRHLGVRSVDELPEYERLHAHEQIEQTLRQNEV